MSGSDIFFHIISQASRFSGEKVIEHKKCVLISLQTSSETFLILRRNEQNMIKSVRSFSCKGPVILPDFNGTWVFWADFRKILKYEIL
jgi:hypothetical protein